MYKSQLLFYGIYHPINEIIKLAQQTGLACDQSLWLPSSDNVLLAVILIIMDTIFFLQNIIVSI